MSRWWLQVAIAAALLGLLLWRVQVWDLGDALRQIDPWTALAVVLLNAPVIAILALRTRLVLRRLGYDASMLSLLPVSAIGNVAASLTPGASGDIIRTPLLKGRHAVTYADGLAMVVYERASSFAILCAASGLVALWAVTPAAVRPAVLLAGLPVLGLPWALGTLLQRTADSRSGALPGFLDRLRRTADGRGERWLSALALIMRDLRLGLLFAALTVTVFASMALQLWLIGASLDAQLSPREAALAMGVGSVAGIVSLLPLGLGALDWTMTALLEQAGATLATAAAAVLLLRATVTLPAGLIGLLAYAYLVVWLRRREATTG
jgi:hypothetical protein